MITGSATDSAKSGAALVRPDIQELIQDAARGMVSIVRAEAINRLSRDQEDIAGPFKRMAFAGIKIATLAEGEVSPWSGFMPTTYNSTGSTPCPLETGMYPCPGVRTAKPPPAWQRAGVSVFGCGDRI
ncbi:recombinase family protein [Nitrospirillum iridis]|uniref:recombinase family protein n=1 Tax=Nitrospirillum iridis TaxID=765888 RepID=UPI003CCD1387